MSDSIKTVYFIGIGGIGMSAIARFFKMKGHSVSGYDKTRTSLTESLITEGIDVHYEEDISKIPKQTDLVIYTPAIAPDNKELSYVLEKKIILKKRSEILGEISSQFFLIAVAGTHGKSTITGLISHIFNNSEIKINAFIGGIVKNYHSNILVSEKAKIFIAEADEFDYSFLELNPDMAVVSSVDADHLDIYYDKKHLEKTYSRFMLRIKKGGVLISNKHIQTPKIKGINQFKYGLNDPIDFYAKNIKLKNAKFYFTANLKGNEFPVCMEIPGRHNIENAMAAAAVCFLNGISIKQIQQGLESYKGICRRFEFRVNKKSIVYIDDYAHHPEELKACIATARELYPNKKITGIFQPHLFSRTLHFAEAFATILDTLNEAILLEIYPAREKPIPGVNSKLLLDKMKLKNKKILSKTELLEELKNKDLDVVLTMGAGDIDQLVEPIEKILNIRM